MRISTGMIYAQGVNAIQDQQAKLFQVSQQVATGRRISVPSDDPIAASRVLEMQQFQANNKQHIDNQGTARDALSALDSNLGVVSEIMIQIRTRAIDAGNAAYGDEQRRLIGSDLRQQFNTLLGLANSTNTNGEFLYSGFKGTTQPVTGSLNGVTYTSDQGQRTLQISPGRLLPVNVNGENMFAGGRVSNSNPLVLAALDNSGSALPVAKTVSASYSGQEYVVRATGPGTFALYNRTTDPEMSAPLSPAPTVTTAGGNTTISFAGNSVSIQGNYNTGDEFTFSSRVDTFQVAGNLVKALENGNASITSFVAGQSLDGMSAGLDSVFRTRASVGSSLVELDAQNDVSSDLVVQYAETLSRLQDVDQVQAISDLTQQKTYLEASQQVFMRISNLTLFNFLS